MIGLDGGGGESRWVDKPLDSRRAVSEVRSRVGKSLWVVELTASLTVEVQVNVTFYVWDANTQTVRRKTNVEVKAVLTVGGADTGVNRLNGK